MGKVCRTVEMAFGLALAALAAAGSEPDPPRGVGRWDALGSALHSFDTRGVDWTGRDFRRDLAVAKGAVQALWLGVPVPPNAAAGLGPERLVRPLPEVTISGAGGAFFTPFVAPSR